MTARDLLRATRVAELRARRLHLMHKRTAAAMVMDCRRVREIEAETCDVTSELMAWELGYDDHPAVAEPQPLAQRAPSLVIGGRALPGSQMGGLRAGQGGTAATDGPAACGGADVLPA